MFQYTILEEVTGVGLLSALASAVSVWDISHYHAGMFSYFVRSIRVFKFDFCSHVRNNSSDCSMVARPVNYLQDYFCRDY